MEDTRTDYARGLDRGLELALEIINSTANTRFISVGEVGLYLHDPEFYAYLNKSETLTEEKV